MQILRAPNRFREKKAEIFICGFEFSKEGEIHLESLW